MRWRSEGLLALALFIAPWAAIAEPQNTCTERFHSRDAKYYCAAYATRIERCLTSGTQKDACEADPASLHLLAQQDAAEAEWTRASSITTAPEVCSWAIDSIAKTACQDAAKSITACVLTGRALNECAAEPESKARLDTIRTSQTARFTLSAMARQADQAARPPPKIGMTPNDILQRSRWGEPISIRRKTTATSVREVWIYSETTHLVFERGRVIEIVE